MVIPSTPGLPWLLRTRFHALRRFSPSHTTSMSCSVTAGLSGAVFAMNGSALGDTMTEASPRSLGPKASEHWVFCRFPLMRCQSYLPLPIVRAFTHCSRLGVSVAPPFGLGCLNRPCRQHDLLCPLLTPASRSGPLAVPPVPKSERGAGLPG